MIGIHVVRRDAFGRILLDLPPYRLDQLALIPEEHINLICSGAGR